MRITLRNYKKAFVIILAILVSILHFVIGPNYRGPFKGFLTGYLLNILIPFWLYFLLTLNLHQMKQKILVCAGIFALAAVIEYSQYRGTALLGTTYDPYDFLAYFSGVISAVLLDLTVLDKIVRTKQSA